MKIKSVMCCIRSSSSNPNRISLLPLRNLWPLYWRCSLLKWLSKGSIRRIPRGLSSVFNSLLISSGITPSSSGSDPIRNYAHKSSKSLTPTKMDGSPLSSTWISSESILEEALTSSTKIQRKSKTNPNHPMFLESVLNNWLSLSWSGVSSKSTSISMILGPKDI